MITNIQTSLTYSTLTLALNAIPAIFDRDYELVLTNGTYDTAGVTTTISKNTNGFSLIIRGESKAGVLLSSTTTTLTLSGNDTVNVVLKDFRVSGGSAQTISIQNPSFITVENVDMVSTLGNFLRITGPTTNNIIIKNCTAITEGHCVLLMSSPSNLSFIDNNFKVDRLVSGLFRCIANGTNVSGSLNIIGNTFEVVNGAEGINLKASALGGNINVERNVFKSCSNVQIRLNNDLSRNVTTVFRNNLFESSVTYSVYVDYGNVAFFNNTVIKNTSLLAAVRFNFIGEFTGFRNNLFYSNNTETDSSSSFASITFLDTNKSVVNVNSDYNLYYAPLVSRVQSTPSGSITIWEPTSKLISVGPITYNTLTTLQSDETDIYSIAEDPLFTLGENNTPYYYLSPESPAHDAADYNVTSGTTDIRGFFRQDMSTDIGAYDIQADEFVKPDNDEFLHQGVIRRNDGATFPNIQLAISSPFYKDETVYLDVTTDTSSNWITMPGISTKNKVIIQPHASISGKLVIRDTINMNLATSISSCSNVMFKNLIFDAYRADGVTPGLCGLSVGLGLSYNLVFDNCEFRNGQHAVYLYTGQDVVFRNCKFYNFYNYAIYGANVRSIYLLGCEFDYGDFAGRENLVTNFEKNLITFKSCNNIVIKNSILKGSIYTENNLRLDDVDNVVLENNIFQDAGGKRALLIQGTSGKMSKNIKVNNNIFKNNGSQLPVGNFSLISMISLEDIEFKNNSFYNNSPNYQNLINIGTNSKNVIACNNFFHSPNTIGRITSIALNLDMSADPSKLIVKNNYTCAQSDARLLTVVGQGVSSLLVFNNVATANMYNFELESIKDVANFDLSNFLVDDIIFNGSLIASGGDFGLANNRDFSGGVKNLSVGFGAYYYNTLPYTPNLSPNVTLFNLTSRDEIPVSTSYEILSNDSIRLTSDSVEVEELPQFVIFNDFNGLFIENVVNINTIDSESESSMRVAIADGNIDLSGVFSIVDVVSNTRYDIEYFYFDVDLNKTYIICLNEIPSNITVKYRLIAYMGIGYSGLLSFAERDKIYDLSVITWSTDNINEVFFDNFITTIQARCKANFVVDNNIVYLGDPVTVTNISIESDTGLFDITGGGIDITGDTSNTIQFTPTLPGDITISLFTNNSSDIPNTKVVNGIVKVLDIPSYPIINFDTNKQILHKDEILKLCATNDINGNNKISRFVGTNLVNFNWKIINSNTNEIYREYQGSNLDVDLSSYNIGSYDIQLTMNFDNNPDVCKDLLEKRYLTVLPSFIDASKKHFITCSDNDSGTDISGYPRTETSIIFGDRTVGCLNTELINPGDVIVLDGKSQNVRFYNLHGTKEAPILIIANCSDGNPFNVKTKTHNGFLFEYCTHFILSGVRNYSEVDLPHSFVIETNLDPRVYGRAPGTMQISLTKFVSDARICGTECKNSKFDCISAKMSPESNDPSTWRNDVTGGWIFDNLEIHHNYLHDSQGEGVYLGHFGSEIQGYANNSQGTFGPYWASILKNTKVFRNMFLNNGFDGIQLSNCFGGAEIHNNVLKNSGVRQVFGQSSGIASNYIIGDIYNNDIGDGIVTFATQGIQRIFNNIIDNGSVVAPADAIYMLSFKPNVLGKWDITQVPQVLTDVFYTGADSKLVIFNNIIRTGRTAILLNPEYGFIPRYVDIVNNVVIMKDNAYDVSNKTGNWWINVINTNNNYPTTLLRNINNLIYKESNVELIKVADVEQGLYNITTSSPLYQSGVDLVQVLGETTYRDKNGLLLPSFDKKYPVGPYDFNPLNIYTRILVLYEFFNNNIQMNSICNTIFLGNVTNNTIKSGLNNCTVGNDFRNNNIGVNFRDNIIGHNFTNNVIEDNFNENNGVNFKNANLVYQPFNKKLFITSDGLQKLRYFTNDGLIIRKYNE